MGKRSVQLCATTGSNFSQLVRRLLPFCVLLDVSTNIVSPVLVKLTKPNTRVRACAHQHCNNEIERPHLFLGQLFFIWLSSSPSSQLPAHLNSCVVRVVVRRKKKALNFCSPVGGTAQHRLGHSWTKRRSWL